MAGTRLLAASVALAGVLHASAAQAEEFRFVALGDMPYGNPDKAFALYRTLIETINATAPDLVVHVGDTKSGSTPCSDRMLDEQLAFLNSFAAPVLYTPGDNEWTDCYRRKAGRFDPRERLDYIRKTYFGAPETTLGAVQVALEHQGDAGFPENARMMHKGVLFVTAHVVGSNNNFEVRDPDAVKEFFARSDATDDWIEESFEAAEDRGAKALVLAIHADMFEFGFDLAGNDEDWLRHSGFRQVGREIRKQSEKFGKPVLLVFGDSHRFRVFTPFPQSAPNVMALEVFGAKDMHAVEVTYVKGASGKAVFAVSPLLNPALN